MKVRGKHFDVERFLLDSPWHKSASISLRGSKGLPHKAPREYSSLCITVESNNYAGVSDQLAACQNLIKRDREEFDRLMHYAGAEQKWFSLSYYLPLGEVMAIGPHFDRDFLSDIQSVGFEFDFNVFLCRP